MESNVVPPQVVPVIEEEIVITKEAVRTGSVRVHKEVEHLQQTVEMPLLREVHSIEHVPINHPVSEIPAMREEGDTIIIPVIEEELIVQKRLVLKEEIHIRRHRTEELVSKSLTIDRERVVVERLDADGILNIEKNGPE